MKLFHFVSMAQSIDSFQEFKQESAVWAFKAPAKVIPTIPKKGDHLGCCCYLNYAAARWQCEATTRQA